MNDGTSNSNSETVQDTAGRLETAVEIIAEAARNIPALRGGVWTSEFWFFILIVVCALGGPLAVNLPPQWSMVAIVVSGVAYNYIRRQIKAVGGQQMLALIDTLAPVLIKAVADFSGKSVSYTSAPIATAPDAVTAPAQPSTPRQSGATTAAATALAALSFLSACGPAPVPRPQAEPGGVTGDGIWQPGGAAQVIQAEVAK